MVKKILYVFFLYCFLFSPPVAVGNIRFYFAWLLWPFALWYFIKNNVEYKKFASTFRIEYYLMGLAIFVSFLHGLVGGDFGVFIRNVRIIFTFMLVPFFLIKKGRQIGICSTDEYVKYLLIAGSIATLISVACLYIPSIDYIVRFEIIKYREGEVGMEMDFRGFGLATQMTSHYSYVLGILVAIGLFYSKRNKWFLFVVPLFLIAAVVNARTGILVAFAGIVVQSFLSRRYVITIIALSVGVLMFLLLPDILNALGANDSTLRWVGSFTNDMEVMSEGDTGGTTIGYMLKEMVVFPFDFIGWFVGYGYSLFGGRMTEYGYFHSDIGFINQLWFGGLLYAILLWYLVFYVSRRFFYFNERAMGVFLFFAFFIINFKGGFVLNTPSFGLILFVYYLVIIQNKGRGVSHNNMQKITK